MAHFAAGTIIVGSQDICIVDAEYIISLVHVMCAAAKAFLVEKRLTRSIAEEFTFHLSPSSNVAESLRRFAPHPDHRIVIVDLGNNRSADQFAAWLEDHLGDDAISLDPDQLASLRTVDLAKFYGISNAEAKTQPPINVERVSMTMVACKQSFSF